MQETSRWCPAFRSRIRMLGRQADRRIALEVVAAALRFCLRLRFLGRRPRGSRRGGSPASRGHGMPVRYTAQLVDQSRHKKRFGKHRRQCTGEPATCRLSPIDELTRRGPDTPGARFRGRRRCRRGWALLPRHCREGPWATGSRVAASSSPVLRHES